MKQVIGNGRDQGKLETACPVYRDNHYSAPADCSQGAICAQSCQIIQN